MPQVGPPGRVPELKQKLKQKAIPTTISVCRAPPVVVPPWTRGAGVRPLRLTLLRLEQGQLLRRLVLLSMLTQMGRKQNDSQVWTTLRGHSLLGGDKTISLEGVIHKTIRIRRSWLLCGALKRPCRTLIVHIAPRSQDRAFLFTAQLEVLLPAGNEQLCSLVPAWRSPIGPDGPGAGSACCTRRVCE